MTYHIVDWDRRFENNRTRDLKKLGWVPVPNHHDGDGFTTLMEMDNGMALYAAWMLIVQVASKCGTRGTLVRDSGTPHDAASLARVTRGQRDVFESAFPVLIDIGWLAVTPHVGAGKTHPPAEPPHKTAKMSQSHACAEGKKEVNGMEEKEEKDCEKPETAPAIPLDDDPVLVLYPVVDNNGEPWPLRKSLADSLQTAYPHLDLMAEFRKAQAWCLTNEPKRKTPRGMPKFLNTWLDNAQNGNGQRTGQRFPSPAPYKSKASQLPTVDELVAAGTIPEQRVRDPVADAEKLRQMREGLAKIGTLGEPPI